MNSPVILFCTWAYRLALFNLTWLLLTIMGGGIFGIFPATVTVAYFIRHLLNGNNLPNATEIMARYKSEFLRSNKLGWALGLPLLSVGWWCGWFINNGSDLAASLSLALVPIVIVGSLILYAALIQLSLYQTQRIAIDISNGIHLVIKDFRVVLLSVVTFLLSVLLCTWVSVLAPLYLVSPTLLVSVGMLWLGNEQLKSQFV